MKEDIHPFFKTPFEEYYGFRKSVREDALQPESLESILGQWTEMEEAAQAVPIRKIREYELSLGRRDRINPGFDEQRIANYLRGHVERFADSLGVSLEDYVRSLPDLSVAERMEGAFIVDPRLSLDSLIDILGINFVSPRDRDYIAGILNPYGNIAEPYIVSGSLNSVPLEDREHRSSSARELIFAHSQNIFDSYLDYGFAVVANYMRGSNVILDIETEKLSFSLTKPERSAVWFSVRK